MDKLKALFGSEALTFEQLEEKLKDNKDVKLANLAGGQYVDKGKLTDVEGELTTAKNTIKELQDTVKKFDGVDVEALKNRASELETKYNSDLAAVKRDNAIYLDLVKAKVKNPKLAMSALDTSIIKLDGDKLVGLSEQIEALKESDGYLFDIEETQTGGATVTTGGHHTNNNNTDNFLSALMKGAGLEEKKGE